MGVINLSDDVESIRSVEERYEAELDEEEQYRKRWQEENEKKNIPYEVLYPKEHGYVDRIRKLEKQQKHEDNIKIYQGIGVMTFVFLLIVLGLI